MCLSIPDFKQYKYENMNIMNNRKAAPGINPSSNPTRPKERKIGILQTLFLHSPFSNLNSLRFVLLCLFLPAISLSIGQVPGTPYGVECECPTPEISDGAKIILSAEYAIKGKTFTASISGVTDATTYTWKLSSGLSVSGTSDDTQTITVIAANAVVNVPISAIKVTAVSNDCGSITQTVQLSKEFTVYEPGKSPYFFGKSIVCYPADKRCSCADKGGIPVFYDDATPDQKQAMRVSDKFSDLSSDYYNNALHRWYCTANWDDGDIRVNDGSVWSIRYSGANESLGAVAVCFD
jgi:hypothetical protein